jgi:hypothetical protein
VTSISERRRANDMSARTATHVPAGDRTIALFKRHIRGRSAREPWIGQARIR